MVAATIGEPLSETGDGDLKYKYMNVISVVFWPPHFGEQMPVGDDLARVAGQDCFDHNFVLQLRDDEATPQIQSLLELAPTMLD